ncbi:MAG: hypothetical protein RLZZ53_447 [Acidobacteriota bacterium]
MAKIAATLALLMTLTASQDTGVLRIRVAMPDGSGGLIPMPRVVLLVSDNPSTSEPRRVRTSNDGTIELRLRAGSYTVESDQPVSLGGRLFAWTQTLDVIAGKEVTLDLGAVNASEDVDAGAAPATSGDAAKVFALWRDSVVEIWTPTSHASGFVIDARGLIATSHRALNGATAVDVQITAGRERLKVPGTVLLSERLTGAAIIWIDPSVAGRPIAPACTPRARAAAFKDPIMAIAAPMLAPKSLSDGSVTRVTEQAIYADLRLARDSGGAPVFDERGELIGLGAFEERREDQKRWTDAWVVPIDKVCAGVDIATSKMTGNPPRPVHLPMEPVQGSTRVEVLTPKKAAEQKRLPVSLTAADFDLTLLTPWHLQSGSTGATAKTDFANWNDYLADAPPLLVIRVTPKFEESVWRTIARGAAMTQGVALPPLPSFRANFVRMRTFCGDTEVTPIQPAMIERPIDEQKTIKEGMYVFPINALGAHCASIRLEIFSEKDPKRPDIRQIDPKLFEQVAQSPIQ